MTLLKKKCASGFVNQESSNGLGLCLCHGKHVLTASPLGVSNAPTGASAVFGRQGCSARGCLHADPAVGPVRSGAASLLILASLLSRALFVQLLLNWTVQGDGPGRVAFPGAGRSLGRQCNRRRTFRPKGASLYK